MGKQFWQGNIRASGWVLRGAVHQSCYGGKGKAETWAVLLGWLVRGGWAHPASSELATSTMFLHKGLAYLLTYFCECLCISVFVVMCMLHSWDLCGDLQICAMWESDFGKVPFALAAGCFAVLCINLVMVVRGRQRCGPSCWAGRCGGGGPAWLYRSLYLIAQISG